MRQTNAHEIFNNILNAGKGKTTTEIANNFKHSAIKELCRVVTDNSFTTGWKTISEVKQEREVSK